MLIVENEVFGRQCLENVGGLEDSQALQYLPRQLLGQFIDAMATEKLLIQK